ncbi:MAG: efflux RND transporter permease subunit, partial [Flavobacterium sp.]|nr:efflux RND transporter permease subunit [Flavobacterium sp.]
LIEANKRLSVAVPVALGLILVLLYFTFKSIKQSLLIFTAIPLSAIGGIIALWLRDMPFSISAGVGFIALFGIAVLNGIVLIEHFKELKHQGMTNMNELILKGTTDRLRPVLLTASAAALGFLPMAISSSAGAEVQRPLATVVIGGLFTATLLTMIVLPILFKIFDEKEFKKPKFKKVKNSDVLLIFMLLPFIGFSQQNNSELDSLVQKAISKNAGIKAGQLKIEKAKQATKLAYDFEKTNVYYSYDQNNLALNELPLKVFGAQQKFAFPTVYGAKKKLYNAEYEKEKTGFEIQQNQLKLQISQVYYQIVNVQHQEKLYHYLDSLYQNFSKASNRRFELGETNYLEKITAEAKFRQIKTKLSQLEKEKKAQLEVLQSLVQSDEKIVISNTISEPISTVTLNSSKDLYVSHLESFTKIYKSNESLQKQNWLPDFNLEYFQGRNNGLSQSLYGFQVGLSVPILFNGNMAKSKVAKLETQAWESQKKQEVTKIDSYIKQKQQEVEQQQEAISYYNEYGKKVSEEIIKVADSSYKHGEIDFFQYILSLENATTIQVDYLDAVKQYNTTILDLYYLNIEN